MLKSLELPNRMAVISAFVGFMLAFVITNGLEFVQLLTPQDTDERGLTGILLILALILGLFVTAFTFRYNRIEGTEDDPMPATTRWIARITTALAAALILFMLTALVTYGINAFFQGIQMLRIFAIIVATAYAGAAGFILTTWSSRIENANLLNLAGVMIVGGIVIAALAVGDANWWQRSLSYLGSTPTAGIYFNVALIITGLLVLVVNQETLLTLRKLVEKEIVSRDYFFWVRIYLYAVAICIIGVGLFPTRITPLSDFLHNLSSHLMLVFFVILMLSTVNRRDSLHPRSFRLASRWLAIFILIFLVLEKAEVVNFVAFELIILVPIGVWIVLYQQQVETLATTGKAPEVERPRVTNPRMSYALNFGAVTAGLGGAISLFYMSGNNTLRFFEPDAARTIGDLWVVMSFVLAAGVTALAYRNFTISQQDLSSAEREALETRRFWISRLVVAAATGIVVFSLTIALIFGIQAVFPDVEINLIGVSLMTAVYSGLVGMGLAYWASNVSNVNLLMLSGITVFLGIGAGALFIGDPEWWQVSLSYLGSYASPVAIFFNLGLIFTGLIVLTVNQDSIGLIKALQDDGRISPDYYMNVRWLLVFIPLLLMSVGIFPRRLSDLYDFLHDMSAMGVGLVFLILAFYAIGRKPSIHEKPFIQQSRFLSITVVVLYVIYILGFVNWVGYELLLFVPIGGWLLLYQVELRRFARTGSVNTNNAQSASA